FLFRPAGLLTTQVAPTATVSAVGQPWFLRPSLSRFVTSPCPGYANRLNRAIDGMGTCTPLDAQPCRLLPRTQVLRTAPLLAAAHMGEHRAREKGQAWHGISRSGTAHSW